MRTTVRFPPRIDADSDVAWQRKGLCFQNDRAHALMFCATSIGKGASSSREVRRAKAICGECLVSDECLDYAMRTRQEFGIWGGLTPLERRQRRRR